MNSVNQTGDETGKLYKEIKAITYSSLTYKIVTR